MSWKVSNYNLKSIVTILVREETLINNWVEFYDALETNDPNFVQWADSFLNGTLNPYGLFRNIISSWVSCKGKDATLALLCNVLKGINQISAAESLENEFGLSNNTKVNSVWPLWYGITEINKHFVGRKNELSELEQIYESRSEKLVVISGLGGIGKSELAKKCANLFFQKGNISCTWFNAGTLGSLHQSLVDLAQSLDIRTTNPSNQTRSIEEISQDLLTAVHNNKDSKFWLVIMDNVDSLDPILAFLKHLCQTKNILIILTTRNIGVVHSDMHNISLDQWTLDDAMEFVKQSLKTSDNELSEAEELCTNLQNHCLAMNQAMAYIIQQKLTSIKGKAYGIKDYLIEFNSKTKELLEFKFNEITQRNIQVTFITWDITLKKLNEDFQQVGALACEVLDFLAYCDPNGIHFGFICKMYPNLGDILTESVTLLKKYSLIKCENSVVYIHRLMQLVIRIKNKYLQKHLPVLTALMEKLKTFSESNQNDITHEISLWNYASEETELVKLFPTVPLGISSRLYHLGFYSKTLEFSEASYKKLANVLSESNIYSLKMKHNLALAANKKGEREKSYLLYKEVWEKMKEILGEHNEFTLKTENNMANVLVFLNRFDEANILLEKILESKKIYYPDNLYEINMTKHELARVLMGKKEFDRAIVINNEVLEWRNANLGEGHPKTLSTRKNLGVCFYELKEYLKAKEIFEEVLEREKNVLGDEHPYSIDTMKWNAYTVAALGEREKALGMLEIVLSIEMRDLGECHPHTVRTQNEIQKLMSQ